MRLRLTLLFALAALAPLAVAQEASLGVTRAYDVKALVAPVLDFAGPDLGLLMGQYRGATIGGGSEDEGLSIDGLMNLIRDNISPDVWEGRNTIRARSGALLIHAPKTVHAKVAYMLAFLRAKHIRTVTLEVAVYRGDSELLGALVAGGPVLDAKRLEGLAKWKRLRSGRLKAFSGQRVNIARLRQMSMLFEYDVEVAQSERVYDPEIRTVPLGEVDDVRPTLADDGKGLLVTCRHTSARLVGKVEQFETGLTSKGGKKVGPLDQPTVASTRMRTSVWIPSSGSAVVGSTTRDGAVEVTVMRHIARKEKLPKRPKSTGKRMLQLIDARYTAFQIDDFKSPRLARQASSSGGGAGATFSEGEEGVELTSEALVEMIKANINEDSWHNNRNRIDGADGRLLIYQTPEVVKQTVEYVRSLENLRSISVLVRAQIFKATPKAADALSKIEGQLTAEQRAELDKQLSEAASLTPIDDVSITALPSQRVYAAGMVDRTYVGDYDVEIAHTSRAHDPEVRVVRAGTTLDVRPTLVQQGGKVLLLLRMSHAAMRGMRVKDIGEGIKVQLPDVDLVERETSLVLGEGGSGVVDLGGGRYALVEVHVSRVKQAKKGDKEKENK